MPVRAVDDKASDTLVVVSDEGFWTGSSTLPHLHQRLITQNAAPDERGVVMSGRVSASSYPVPTSTTPVIRE